MGLIDVFDLQTVVSLSPPRIYERGVRYHAEGRVEPEAGSGERLRATVRGTVPYTVELWVDRGNPVWSCSCPYAEDGAFCKHCVAVGLLVASGPDPIGVAVLRIDEPSTGDDVAGHVEAMPRERLVEIVLDQCEKDWRLRERMAAEAQVARGDGPDTNMWRRRIDSAFAPHRDYVDYREAGDWAAGVFDMIEGLADLLDGGQGDAVIELTEHAHRRADAAVGYVDDSDGWLTGIENQLSQLHRDACEVARPDPLALARRLADLELTSELDGFHRSAITYSALLGEAGINEFRGIVESESDAAGDETDEWGGIRFSLDQARIGVAIASGDPDELVAVHGDNLRSPRDHLEIARMMLSSDRVDEAVEWSQRGLAEFADRTFQLPELRDFLAAVLRSQGRDLDAVDLYWSGFLAAPSMASYRSLLNEAANDAEGWKSRCVEVLRNNLADVSEEEIAAPNWRVGYPASALIEILMYEGELESAWTVATEYGCSDSTWMTLARAREDTHPLASIAVYERTVFDEIDKKKRNAYLAAVDLLSRIRDLAGSAGQPERFTDVVERVRSEHRPKRSLMAMLDDKDW
jgi:uncharacterized Zn finger protein